MRISPPFSSYIKELTPPPLPLSGFEHVSWHCPSTCLHVHVTCIITIVIFGYVRSITNKRPLHRWQWFITVATYCSLCNITVMHLRFISSLSISFVKNSRDHQWSLFSGEYFIILLDLLTIRHWRDHGSDRNTSGTLFNWFAFVILYF